MGDFQAIYAVVVFVLAYALIIVEKMHRTIVALAGAVLILLPRILSQEEALQFIEFNTLGLLIGMMVIVGITRRTGLFEYLAVGAARWAKGEPLRILAALSVITAVASALLDNITTVLLIVPVTYSIVKELRVSITPFLISEIIASNIGGTATLIGDPPNIMIGGFAGLPFSAFLFNLGPVVLIIFILTLWILKLIYRRRLVTAEELKKKLITVDAAGQIRHPVLLRQSLFVLGLTVLGFMIHDLLGLESATVALAGATLLLLITRPDPDSVFNTVEWSSIFFFIGLFVMVGALEKAGILEVAAAKALDLTGGQLLTTGLLILWLSALASTFVDNIPFVATMIPMIFDMGRLGGIADLNPLWWSLALGGCLGGNGSLIGAAANVIVAGIAEREGDPISFIQFFKIGFPLMILSVAIASVYLVLFYLR